MFHSVRFYKTTISDTIIIINKKFDKEKLNKLYKLQYDKYGTLENMMK